MGDFNAILSADDRTGGGTVLGLGTKMTLLHA
jgi:hypothetical protein